MPYNVLINSVNIAYQKEKEDQLLLLVEIVENPNLPNVQVLGAEMDRRLVGYLITELLRVLQVPTLNHAHNVPAILELNEQQWTLKNFINEDITYNTETITNYILDATYKDASTRDIDILEPS
jgi:hypothetical protein